VSIIMLASLQNPAFESFAHSSALPNASLSDLASRSAPPDQATAPPAGLLGIADGALNGAAIRFTERTDPATPATNSGYLYMRDNGSG
jgi:hypothetical protein